jgi:hypothetical protein
MRSRVERAAEGSSNKVEALISLAIGRALVMRCYQPEASSEERQR